MDGTRIRMLALAAPLVIGLTLAVAALLATPGTGDTGAPRVLQTSLTGPVRAVPTAASSVLPRTTPPPFPVVDAVTGVAPVPAPEQARTVPQSLDGS